MEAREIKVGLDRREEVWVIFAEADSTKLKIYHIYVSIYLKKKRKQPSDK